MKFLKITILIISVSLICRTGYSWETYDKLIATVNETPIIESNVLDKLEKLINNKKFSQKKLSDEKSRILDKFIEDAIIEQTARKESIIVSQKKIDNQITKIMERMDIKSIEAFRKHIEKSQNTSFQEYKEEIKKSIMTEQVMSIAIGITPPSLKEAQDWYKKNKSKMGYEINLQNIMIYLKNDSFAENKRANKEASDLLNKIRKGQSFEAVAKEFSEDNSTKHSGGNMGWVALSNLAKNDYIMANNVYKELVIEKRKLAVIKSTSGYHVVKNNGARPTSFESVKDDIFNMLYHQKMEEQFKKWVAQKKNESEIKIFMPDYIKEKANG